MRQDTGSERKKQKLKLWLRMGELQDATSPPLASAEPPPRFDPSRMIGIIRRKALIKDLAAAYHAECLTYCQELLELQKKCEESFIDVKVADESRKEVMRPPKRLKKSR